MIKLVMFDLDGTLVDSGADLTNALNYAIAPYPMGKLSVAETVALVGEGVSRLISKVVGRQCGDMRDDVLSRFVEYYSLHLSDETRPYPGVAAMLRQLSDRKKAVISNKMEAMSVKLLTDLGLREYFDLVLGSDSVDETKPSPKPLLHTLRHFSVAPEEAIMIGDSTYDIQAGRSAGVSAVGVSYGFRDASTLSDADFILDTMEDLLPLIKKLDSRKKT